MVVDARHQHLRSRVTFFSPLEDLQLLFHLGTLSIAVPQSREYQVVFWGPQDHPHIQWFTKKTQDSTFTCTHG